MPSLHLRVVAIEKGAFGPSSTKVADFTYIYIYIYIYIISLNIYLAKTYIINMNTY